jgi:hypothetical protein
MCVCVCVFFFFNNKDHRIDPWDTPCSIIPKSDKNFGVAVGDCISAFCVLLSRTGTNLHLILECHKNVTELTEVHDLHIRSIGNF